MNVSNLGSCDKKVVAVRSKWWHEVVLNGYSLTVFSRQVVNFP